MEWGRGGGGGVLYLAMLPLVDKGGEEDLLVGDVGRGRGRGRCRHLQEARGVGRRINIYGRHAPHSNSERY